MIVLKVLWEVVKACLYVIGAIFDGLVTGGEKADQYQWGRRVTVPPTRDPHSRAYIGPNR